MAETKYLTAKELAHRWRYKTDKPIYELKEQIGYTKIRGRILFPLEKVEAYEIANSIETTTDETKTV